MDNRRVLIAVLLSMIVIVGWQLLFPPPEPPRPPAGGEMPAAVTPAPDPAGISAADPTGQAALPGGEGAAVATAEEDGAAAELASPIEADREQVVVLEGDGYRAELTNRGAQLVSLEVLGYKGAEGRAVDLVRRRSGASYPFSLVTPAGAPLPVTEALFTVEEEPAGDEPAVVFTYRGPAGRVTKRFAVRAGGLLGITVEAADLGSPWGLMVGPGLRNPTAIDAERRFKYRGAVYRAADDLETLDSQKLGAETVIPGGGLSWIGLEDTYFLAAFVPDTPVDRAVVQPWLETPGAEGEGVGFERLGPDGPTETQEDLERELELVLVPQGDRLELSAYLGAKDYERLSALPWTLEETVRLGWFGFLAKGLLIGLKWIYLHVVPNYGWAIVLMTILIKIVLMPLTHKSYVSMQKMQELAPKVKAIRNKFKGKLRDKKGRPDLEAQRKMNEEVSALYRTEGVNPAGGCLPMLLQFPVLLAFYRLLSNAVELRDAPWMLWIQDLSMHDPYYVLPIIMGGVQFLQQRMAPSAMEPMQRRMMMAMPVVFTVLFLGFPSGLVLYWLTNNLLTLIQQGVYQHLKARNAAQAAASS